MVLLRDAVVQSCDVYFYKLAVATQIDAMKDFLAPFGFGKKTGVDLPGESEGLLPSTAWKEARGLKWLPGETVIVGIGQGPILATPLQLVSAMSALANRGVRMRPTLVRAVVNPATQQERGIVPVPYSELPLKDKTHLETMIEYLTDAVHSPRGTAYGIGHNAPYKIAGKTGTAQVKGIAQGAKYSEHATPERFRDHALFISFAPAEQPRVVVAVIVENGGHGSSAAAPIARKVMDYVILAKNLPINIPAKMENEE